MNPNFPVDRIECWVFDLDNTLYPAASNLFVQVSRRMTAFIQDKFALNFDDAKALQREMFLKYGTTLRGLMVEHDLDPHAYLDFVHDIDVSVLPVSNELSDLLGQLPGRKVIYTNGSVPHADRVCRHLGIEHHFEGTFDIVASEFEPKPNLPPYQKMIERFGFDPSRAAMVEDMAKNLKPAAELGMTTVLLRSDYDWAQVDDKDDHVHHIHDDLVSFLRHALQSPQA